MSKTIFRPFGILNILKIEEWLKNQSQKGLKLISYRHWKFTFENSDPKEREYYIFLQFLGDKKDSFSGEIFSVKKLYSLRKSKLNKTNSVITEIDTNKIDKDYIHFSLSKLQYYINQYFQFLMIFICLFGISMIATAFEIILIPLPLLMFVIVMYYSFSLFTLRKQKKSLRNVSYIK